MDYRAGEKHGTFFRMDRCYCTNGEWYFSTREGVEVGPFRSHADAEVELLMFIRHTHDEHFPGQAVELSVNAIKTD